ncbi:hypothetical protein [Rhizobium hidalgonense]|uniref:hypothetical protein n=1 Tax=Rhizobium hidalgonense TaxID=1538159 RepID=UPI00027D3382|nr:hypothetical protein [Rhizobium hidalgonense]EJC73473.1 hypothetical protein Rleg10DRAFT_1931 [Rhizobium leguminosarum bv. trifolii WSM2012]MDR9803560.1 hypothetical protein [Rhizobium hidalgonense]RWX15282.1 hypothetical protein EHI42_15355 [Rhizobium hidalgonense]
MRTVLFGTLAIIICCPILLFAAFPVEYLRSFGQYQESQALNQMAVPIAKFYIQHDMRYACGNETYFRNYNAMSFFDDLPLSPEEELMLQSQDKIVLLFLSDVVYDENEYLDSIRTVTAYNTVVASKCLHRRTS